MWMKYGNIFTKMVNFPRNIKNQKTRERERERERENERESMCKREMNDVVTKEKDIYYI